MTTRQGQELDADVQDDDRIIKRYANRKLYDTSRSCYVTLEDVAEMIRKGEGLRVIDNRTQDDLTAVTLAQIIFEQQKSRRRAMPIPALRAIIERPAELFQKLSAPVSQLRGEAVRQVDKLKQKRAETLEDGRQAIDEGRQVIIDAIENMQLAIEETQQRVDERVKAAVDALTHVPDLQRDVDLIRDRLTRLESLAIHLARATGVSVDVLDDDVDLDGGS